MNETPNHLLALNDPAPNHAGNSILARGCRGPSHDLRRARQLRYRDGQSFDGSKTYRLTVPASPPIERYWSVTAYDRETSRHGSREPLLADSDATERGRIDRRLFRPQRTCWQRNELGPDRSKRGFELMFRLYAPKNEVLRQVWRLPDVERLAAQ